MSHLRHILTSFVMCISLYSATAQTLRRDSLQEQETSPLHIRQDSLKAILAYTKEPYKRIDLLLNLKDLAEGEENETGYTLQLFEESKKARDPFGLFVAITHFVIKNSTHQEKQDSLHNYYIKAIKEIEKGTPAEGASTFFCMNINHSRIAAEVDKIKRAALSRQIFKEMEARRPKENKYEKVERLFIQGVIELWRLSDEGKSKIYVPEIPLWEEAWEMAKSFPDYTRRYFLGSIHSCLSGGYNQKEDYESQKRISYAIINEYKTYYVIAAKVYPRPFLYQDNSYVKFYTQLIRGAMYVSDEEAYSVYNLFRTHMLSAKGEFLNKNKVYLHETAYLFLGNMHRVDEALANCDSLIRMIETGRAKGYKRSLKVYKDKASLFRRANRPEDACTAYERAMQVSDSLIKREYVERVEALKLKSDVNQLELEKTELTAQNRLIGFIFAICIVVVAVSISVYYYRSLKKTKILQDEIYRQSIKAQESEQMKSAFINSICHEIRTPLNSINGFSEILTDESTLPNERKEYQQIIQENTRLLTSLLDSLIEIANLDSLSGSLSMEKMEITQLCQSEMEFLQKTEGKVAIQYLLDLPTEGCIAYTHSQYLCLLVRSLLNNANKFTIEGSITLKCCLDDTKKSAIISITDTGCGIPADKHEYIFQRFTKLDTFTHGNGLGLYLCRLIARHLHGDIQIDNEVTQGIRFIFTIPTGGSE